MHPTRVAQLAAVAIGSLFGTSAGAQQNGTRLDFSGVIFANYQWRADSAARLAAGGQAINKFDLQRVYLNFRMPAGDKASIRVTTDLFQQLNTLSNAFYAGWTVRLKYAYLQYDFTNSLAGVEGLGAVGRLGLLHTVMIDHIDSFWLRWLGVNALETHG